MMVEAERLLETLDLNSAFGAGERGIFKAHLNAVKAHTSLYWVGRKPATDQLGSPAPTRCRRRCRTITANRV